MYNTFIYLKCQKKKSGSGNNENVRKMWRGAWDSEEVGEEAKKAYGAKFGMSFQ